MWARAGVRPIARPALLHRRRWSRPGDRVASRRALASVVVAVTVSSVVVLRVLAEASAPLLTTPGGVPAGRVVFDGNGRHHVGVRRAVVRVPPRRAERVRPLPRRAESAEEAVRAERAVGVAPRAPADNVVAGSCPLDRVPSFDGDGCAGNGSGAPGDRVRGVRGVGGGGVAPQCSSRWCR